MASTRAEFIARRHHEVEAPASALPAAAVRPDGPAAGQHPAGWTASKAREQRHTGPAHVSRRARAQAAPRVRAVGLSVVHQVPETREETPWWSW